MKKLAVTLIVSIFMFVMASMAMADEAPTPTSLEGVKIVSADDVKGLLGQKGVYIFDMRKSLNFGKGHFQGATSLPFKWLTEGEPSTRKGEFDMAVLPADKNAKVLFHSDGPTGWKSYYAAKVTKEAGYKNVMWYRGGTEDWSAKGYTLEH